MEETLDFHEQIKKLIEERRFKELRVLFAESNAIDIAEALYGLSEKELIYAFRMLSKEQAADAFAAMDRDEQEMLIKSFTDNLHSQRQTIFIKTYRQTQCRQSG